MWSIWAVWGFGAQEASFRGPQNEQLRFDHHWVAAKELSYHNPQSHVMYSIYIPIMVRTHKFLNSNPDQALYLAGL